MRNTSRIFAALMITVSLTACSTFSRAREENMKEVHPGLSQEQVVKILGKPDRREAQGRTEKWHYQIISSDYRRFYPYVATFEDGRLATFYLSAERADDSRAPGSLHAPF